MAVFTPVEPDQLDPWLRQYSLGKVIDFRGIGAGIENSNFFLTTAAVAASNDASPMPHEDHVLTLFERLTAAQLPFYLELMRHLAEHQVPCPAPLANRSGALFSPLNGKPAALVTRLPGHWVPEPNPFHCAAVGRALAQLHLAGRDFKMQQPNLRGLAWWQEVAPQVLPYCDADSAQLLMREVAYQTEVLTPLMTALPSGPIHADLFRDNVLFEGTAEAPVLGGLIDFYFAGCDLWLFDVAVCINDWCIDLATGALDAMRTQALLQAYAEVRPFKADERPVWSTLLRAAALRFWLSRLWDFHLPRPAEMLTPHDPKHFERILRLRCTAPVPELP